MAGSSRLPVPAVSPRTGELSPSFSQTTAEFNLDSDLDLDDAEEDLHLREMDLGGGQAYKLRSLKSPSTEEGDDGWGDAGMPSLRRRASTSTVASFQLYTPDEERAVVRKHDRSLVLFVALLFMLSFLDRSSLANHPLMCFLTLTQWPQTLATRVSPAWTKTCSQSRPGTVGTSGR